MTSVLPLALVVSLAAAPAPEPRTVPRTAALILGATGALVMGLGAGLEVKARLAAPPNTPASQWPSATRGDLVGGVALLGTGLCLLTLAALVLHHRVPPIALHLERGGASVTVGVRW
jgi:hypothetical protein